MGLPSPSLLSWGEKENYRPKSCSILTISFRVLSVFHIIKLGQKARLRSPPSGRISRVCLSSLDWKFPKNMNNLTHETVNSPYASSVRLGFHEGWGSISPDRLGAPDVRGYATPTGRKLLGDKVYLLLSLTAPCKASVYLVMSSQKVLIEALRLNHPHRHETLVTPSH